MINKLAIWAILFFVSAASSTFAQTNLANQGLRAAQARNAARANQLAIAAAKNTQWRINKEYRRILKDGVQIWEESDGILSSMRTWKAGIYTFQGALCRADNGKVTLCGARGNVVNEKISKLSDDDKKYVKQWRSFEKLGKSRRVEWVEEYYKQIEEEKAAIAKAQADKLAKEKAKQQEIARQKQALKDAEAGLQLIQFESLAEAYKKITPGVTDYEQAIGWLGDKPETVSGWVKDITGETGSFKWIARHPETSKLAYLQIVFKNRIVASVKTVNIE